MKKFLGCKGLGGAIFALGLAWVTPVYAATTIITNGVMYDGREDDLGVVITTGGWGYRGGYGEFHEDPIRPVNGDWHGHGQGGYTGNPWQGQGGYRGPSQGNAWQGHRGGGQGGPRVHGGRGGGRSRGGGRGRR